MQLLSGIWTSGVLRFMDLETTQKHLNMKEQHVDSQHQTAQPRKDN
jgi:hypothetical protein